MSDECKIERSIPYGKKLLIKEVEGIEQALDEGTERLQKSIEGEDMPVVVTFDDPERIREILTPKRRELVKAIIVGEPGSVKELAEITERGLSEVHQDLKVLEQNKIIYFEKDGRKKKPVMPYDDIEVRYNLRDDVLNMETDLNLEKA